MFLTILLLLTLTDRLRIRLNADCARARSKVFDWLISCWCTPDWRISCRCTPGWRNSCWFLADWRISYLYPSNWRILHRRWLVWTSQTVVSATCVSWPACHQLTSATGQMLVRLLSDPPLLLQLLLGQPVRHDAGGGGRSAATQTTHKRKRGVRRGQEKCALSPSSPFPALQPAALWLLPHCALWLGRKCGGRSNGSKQASQACRTMATNESHRRSQRARTPSHATSKYKYFDYPGLEN